LSLNELLKTNKDARKIFGRKEIEIILKQINGISLTQSEKNRLSRDIRPKFRFIKEVSLFQDEFELKKDSAATKIIKRIVNLILQDELANNVKAILLFGSHVLGNVTPRSDIDITVIFTKISLKKATKFRIRISREFSKKVDIQVFNVLPQKIKREIAKKYNILYKTPDFDNANFFISYLKEDDYFIRKHKFFGDNYGKNK